MKTIVILFALLFTGSILSAQVVKTRKIKVSKEIVQPKTIEHKEAKVDSKKGLVKKTLIRDREKVMVRGRNDLKK